VNAEHIHAVEQVLAETPALDFRRQVAIRRRNDPHVDADGLFPADALDCFFLEGAQELCLNARWHFPDLVEKDGAPVGELELPDVGLAGPCKGALFVAEKDRFHELGGDGRAVDDDERRLPEACPSR
jgi:hypothetical protein